MKSKSKKEPRWKSFPRHEDMMVERFKKDPDAGLLYLQVVLEDSPDMPEVFLEGIQLIARARGMKDIAEKAGLNREQIYRSFSKKGNPTLSSLVAMLDTLGFRLTVEAKKQS